MKTMLIFSSLHASVRCILVALFVVLSSSLFAQMIGRQTFLNENPDQLKAAVFPSARPSVMHIRFDNEAKCSSVHIQIFRTDKSKTAVYDDYVTERKFAGLFDISALPSGHYTVELTTCTNQYVQAFVFDEPKANRIVMIPAGQSSTGLAAKN